MVDNNTTTSGGANELPELEKVCGQCDGNGLYGYEYCDVCEGTGLELTAAGKKILSMICGHFGIVLRSYMND